MTPVGEIDVTADISASEVLTREITHFLKVKKRLKKTKNWKNLFWDHRGVLLLLVVVAGTKYVNLLHELCLKMSSCATFLHLATIASVLPSETLPKPNAV